MVRRSSPAPRRRSMFTARLAKSTEDGEQPRVLDDLHTAILAGEEPPGTIIPIDAVAEFFGVSQIPVREALKTLIGEGLVEHVPRVGYSVAMLTFAEFRELYEVRRALESAALRNAVERATDDDLAAIERALDLVSTAGTSPDRDERDYHELTRMFHLSLLRPAAMARLLHMYESAWNVTEPVRPMTRVSDQARRVFAADHRRMAEAFLARDAEALVAESDRHYAHLFDSMELLADDPTLFRPEPEKQE